MVDVYLQARRDGAAAKRFFKRIMKSHGDEPRSIVTDKNLFNLGRHLVRGQLSGGTGLVKNGVADLCKRHGVAMSFIQRR